MKPDYSSDAFKAFLSEQMQSDISNDATLRNLKNTGLLLMGNVGDSEFSDMRTVSADELIARHLDVSNTEMSDGSQKTYKSRFNSAVGRFIQHQDGKHGLQSNLKDVIRNTALDGLDLPQLTDVMQSKRPTPSAQNAALPIPSNKVDVFSVPILLRPKTGLTIQITGIPLDITNEESELVASILKAYVRSR